jgi:Holliday junction resolvasome RuvABC endonuclease subunit
VRILAIDPGAKRLGWAILNLIDGVPTCPRSGILSCERGDKELYQAYRLRAMGEGVQWAQALYNGQNYFDEVVHETLPAKGFNDMGQAYLALSVISAVSGYFMSRSIPITQIGATTVKARIGGSNKATKVRVRNGVWQLIPELQAKAPEWKKVYDESDAVAIGLTHLGFTRK